MRVYDYKKEKMVDGNVKDISPFLTIIGSQFERITENVNKNLYKKDRNKIIKKYNKNEINSEEKEIELQKIAERVSNLNEDDKRILLEAIPLDKVYDYFEFNIDKIVKQYSSYTGNLEEDYKDFDGYERIKEELFRKPTEEEKGDGNIDFIYFKKLKQHIIISDNNDILKLEKKIKSEAKIF